MADTLPVRPHVVHELTVSDIKSFARLGRSYPYTVLFWSRGRGGWTRYGNYLTAVSARTDLTFLRQNPSMGEIAIIHWGEDA